MLVGIGQQHILIHVYDVPHSATVLRDLNSFLLVKA